MCDALVPIDPSVRLGAQVDYLSGRALEAIDEALGVLAHNLVKIADLTS